MPGNDRGRPLGLGADHARQARGATRGVVLAKTLPVRGDVAGVADRQEQIVGGVAEGVDDLKGRGLLALQPVRVDRVHQGDGVPAGQVAHGLQRGVEAAFERDHLGAVHKRLRELVHGDLARGDDHDGADAHACGIGGHRCGCVASRSAHQNAAAGLERLRHRNHHAAVLERTGGIQALVLEKETAEAQGPTDVAARHERSRAFLKIDLRCRRADREKFAVPSDDSQLEKSQPALSPPRGREAGERGVSPEARHY